MITLDTARRHSDADLLSAATRLAAAGREVTADLVALLAVLIERGLYAGEGYGSAHDFCVARLCLSDAQAYHRLAAAQVAARFPQVLEGLRSGALTLTNVALLRPHLTEANAGRLLAWAEGRRKHEVEREIRRLAPRPDVAASLRRLPAPASPTLREVASSTGSLPAAASPARREVATSTRPLPAGPGSALREAALAPGGVGTSGSPAPRDFTAEPVPTAARLARPDVAPSPEGGDARSASGALAGGDCGCPTDAGAGAPLLVSSDAGECEAGSGLSPQAPIFPAPSGRAEIRPLSPARYSLRITISEETHAKLRRARDLLGHAVPGGDLAEVLDRALTLLVERLEQRKCGVKKGRGSVREASAPASGARARESKRPGRHERPTDHGRGPQGDQRTPPAASNQPAAAQASDTPAPASAPEHPSPRKPLRAGTSRTRQARQTTPAAADRTAEVAASASAPSQPAPTHPAGNGIPRTRTTADPTPVATDDGPRPEATPPADAARARHRRSRYIPAAVRRAVWERDRGRCAFVGADGRCAQTRRLEFHHRVPFAEGGAPSVENLVLACALHNQWEAARWFGEEAVPAAAGRGGAAVVGTARAATGSAAILISQSASGRASPRPGMATADDATTPAAPRS